ncbi:MAG: PAS domain S-box protein [Deltaproteobacteria bacterium]|nr:PAS domain S-box protein [Deltaproteobacteria bacterium]
MGDDESVAHELGPLIAKIREQTKLLRSILSSMGDGLIVADLNGKFLVFNPEAERIVGVGATPTSPEQWPERYGLFRPDGTTPFPTNEIPMVRAIRGEEADNVEMFVRNANVPDGVWISVTGRPLLDDEGVLRGGVVVLRDVTHRYR